MGDERVKILLLGPVEVAGPGGTVSGPPQQRRLLAALAADAGRPVATETLIDRVWDEAPNGARRTLHVLLTQLRRTLRQAGAAATITHRSGGYLLDIDPRLVDLHRLRALLQRAREPERTGGERVALLRQARLLWRGEPLAGLAGQWPARARAVWHQEYLDAMTAWADAELSAGDPAAVIGPLTALASEHPFVEPLVAALMRAQSRTGRTAEALAQYAAVRQRLAEQLGVDPGPELRAAHREILGGPPPPRAAAPALLPPDIPDFASRAEQVTELESLLTRRGRTAPAIAGIAGMGGAGKSTLAVHVAHCIAGSYTDGQLYVNLRGADHEPLEPHDVLGVLLRALGVDWRAVPPGTAERTAQYRGLVAGRRILVVLDNVASAEQIRPLLPGAATCAVLVTSRPRLTGIEGSRWIDLGMLDDADAAALLRRVVGDNRVTGQPAEAAEVIRLCGGLPLAVRVAGARLTARPAWPLTHLAGLLRDERYRLDRLVQGDLEVRASLALSYQELDAAARRLFGLLGLFDVPDFTVWLAASVLKVSTSEATRHVESLVDVALLTANGADCAGQVRYRFHDLVRLYARERAEAELLPEQRLRALRLGFGGLLGLAERMAPRVPGPCYALMTGSAPRPAFDWAKEDVDRLDPMRWFDAERAVLLSAVRQACGLDLAEVAVGLAGCLEKYFDVRGMYADWQATGERVLATCRRTGDRHGEAVMLRGLLDVRTWISGAHSGDAMTESQAGAEELLTLFTELGDVRGRSDAEVACAWAFAARGLPADAIAAATRALRLARDSDHLGGQARAHVALAVAYRERALLDKGMSHLTEALAASRSLGNARYEATVLQFLGIGQLEVGDLAGSERRLHESLSISLRYDDGYTEALTRLTLARLHLRRGDARARAEAETALAIARKYRMGHHVAEALAVLGEIELTDGRPADAVRWLAESVSIWRTRGWLSYEAAALALLEKARAALEPSRD